MNSSPNLSTLKEYLAGEFDNKQQAIAEPAWYVRLHMWQRPVPLFQEDSLTLFAEQANILNLEQPYRQRLLRITQHIADASFKVQYYMFKNPAAWRGAGRNFELLKSLTSEQVDILPGCVLKVNVETIAPNQYKFIAKPIPDTHCTFDYDGKTVEVSLGFEATQNEFLSYDKGIDRETRKATWGAILGPYRYTKLVVGR
ncbi:MAG: chromophore lyase CpcT/CpeT [Rivularia sp. T60_A2020_040]|nr:chromophore lyase CpcT/CpeT [Rivularia sp. T60_A2020_040]